MKASEFCIATAAKLDNSTSVAARLTAFVGLDGFVDEIIHVVDKRESATQFLRVPTIAKFAERLAAAAGRGTNIELVSMVTKLGGNGPIMANSLASFGVKVTYLGNLGYPNIHPIFDEFTQCAEVHSIAQPGFTDALEFDDGKIMLGKPQYLKDVTWSNIEARFGRDKFATHFGSTALVGFVNWTMLSFMSDIWDAVQREICPTLAGPRRKLFIDLADPEKRTAEDIGQALDLIQKFERWFDVILGLNEKEAGEIGQVLGLDIHNNNREGLCELALAINRLIPVNTIVVHPVSFALTAGQGGISLVEGPFVAKPKITTGAGDHFNSGFCLGRLLGLDNEASLLCGVTTSGHYVRTGTSPSIADHSAFMRNWPAK
jgi:hypothetical protein